MKLTVLGSSSAGNCYVLTNNKETLLIECGVSYKDISKELNFNYGNVVGCLISHRHGDHCKSANKLDGLVDIYCSHDVAQRCDLSFYKSIEPRNVYKMGGFTVMPFEVTHDVPCLGFFILHEDMGRLAFITDSAYSEYSFKDVNHLLVECNYTSESLEDAILNGVTPDSHRMRLLNTHMELKETINVVEQNISDKLYNVILLHLSSRNSDEMAMLDAVERRLGFKAHIATPNLTLNLSNNIY